MGTTQEESAPAQRRGLSIWGTLGGREYLGESSGKWMGRSRKLTRAARGQRAPQPARTCGGNPIMLTLLLDHIASTTVTPAPATPTTPAPAKPPAPKPFSPEWNPDPTPAITPEPQN